MAIKLEGLLWGADGPGESINSVLAGGVSRFKARFGYPPAIVYVNEKQVGQVEPVAGLEVRAAKNIVKNSVWVVKEERDNVG
jgi:hypothetical protein